MIGLEASGGDCQPRNHRLEGEHTDLMIVTGLVLCTARSIDSCTPKEIVPQKNTPSLTCTLLSESHSDYRCHCIGFRVEAYAGVANCASSSHFNH